MSVHFTSVDDTVECIERGDTITTVFLEYKHLSDSQAATIIDCLVRNPDSVASVWLSHNRLTDESGVKLARVVERSSTIKHLGLCNNNFTEVTHRAMARALCVNTSLSGLFTYCNATANIAYIDAVYAHALRVNPTRPVDSQWFLYVRDENEGYGCFKVVKAIAEQMGHPTLQELLCGRHLREIE